MIYVNRGSFLEVKKPGLRLVHLVRMSTKDKVPPKGNSAFPQYLIKPI